MTVTDIPPLDTWTSDALDAAIRAETVFVVASSPMHSVECCLVAYDLADHEKIGAFCLPDADCRQTDYVFTRELWAVFAVKGESPGYLTSFGNRLMSENPDNL